MLNLVLALLWLVVGVGLLTHQYLTGDARWVLPVGNGLSVGWLALVLAVYNVIRWYSARASRLARQAQHAAMQRSRYPATRRSEPLGEPDPNFNFTDEPPPVRPPQPPPA